MSFRRYSGVFVIAIAVFLGACSPSVRSEDAASVASSQGIPTTTSSTEPLTADPAAPAVQAPSGAAGSPAPSTTAVARPSGKTNAEIDADMAAIRRQYEIDSAKRQAEYEAGRRARLAECLDDAAQMRDEGSVRVEELIRSGQSVMMPPYSSTQLADWDQMRQNIVTNYNYSVQNCYILLG
jgi:hypothetical protein